MGTSWHSYIVKASRTSPSAMISITTIISLLTLLWSPTNGDSHPLLKSWTSLIFSIGRCQTTNGTTQIRASSDPNAFWRTENLTVQLEIQWISHLDLVGGEIYYFHRSVSRGLEYLHHHHPGRICPGKHIAHSTITLAAASVLSTFDLLKKVDENGWEIEPKKEYKGAAIR